MKPAPFVFVLAALVSTGCAQLQSAMLPAAARLSGSVDGAVLIGVPPSGERARADAAAMRGPWTDARIAQARADDRFDAFRAFQPVMGQTFTPQRFPQTRRALDRLVLPLGAAIGLAKDHYSRARPFVVDPALPTCVRIGAGIRASGSYPSGHAAFGWAWALVLAEILPGRADAILLRGREYGDSRVICGVHFPSDVEAGRILAAAAVARLHADAGFRRAIAAAREEVAALQH